MQENDTQQNQHKTEIKNFDFSTEFDTLINARGRVTPSLLTAVNRYFLYFSFFESLLLDCSGGQGKCAAYAKVMIERVLFDKDVTNNTFSFFSKRYVGDRQRYDSLCGEKKHTKPELKEYYYGVMTAQPEDLGIQLELCLFVCFRLRNNLFHGPKWRHYLKGQEELLLTAGTLIHSIISKAEGKDDWEFQSLLNSND
ncbi:hypothetical protein NGK27_07775 [Klebsiella quasipneumoniae]|nr:MULTISPECIES: hypothetical protein [Klebsiella]MCB3415581.1 hypothetical protein [Klebsiella pneumoniae]MCB3598759.1 hypothetical protein [Klebsiella pneumoniae]MCB3605663.1 hypothetical protein [Klebsiella pneumoniae]MCB3664881.1 hypothetical protein [Klebsiella pneumoniae]MEB7827166.1 hypothetical protein [Klebsiella quasipneumoniae]